MLNTFRFEVSMTLKIIKNWKNEVFDLFFDPQFWGIKAQMCFSHLRMISYLHKNRTHKYIYIYIRINLWWEYENKLHCASNRTNNTWFWGDSMRQMTFMFNTFSKIALFESILDSKWPLKLHCWAQPIFEAKTLLNRENLEKVLNMKVVHFNKAPQNNVLFIWFGAQCNLFSP